MGEVASNLYNSQAGLLTELGDFLKGEVGKPGPQYTGDLAPGASELQQTSFDLARQYATGPNRADPALARLLGGETGFVPDTGESERYFQANVAKPLEREQERSFNQIDQRLALRGTADSGIRGRALADAHRSFLDAKERGRSEFAYKDLNAMRTSREAALDRMSQAIAQSLGLDMSKIAVAGAAGDVQRDIEGQKQQDAYRHFLEAQPMFNPALQMIGGPIQQPAAPLMGTKHQGGVWGDAALKMVSGLVNPTQGMFGGGGGGGFMS